MKERRKKTSRHFTKNENSNNDRAEACLNPIVWSCRLLAGLVRRLLERRYRRRYSVQRERLLHHQRCIVLVDSPLYCVQWETISSFERERARSRETYTLTSAADQRLKGHSAATPGTEWHWASPPRRSRRACVPRASDHPPNTMERINRWKRTPPRGWCTHYSSSRRRDHRIAVTRRVYACFAMRIRRGVDIRAQLLTVGKFREGLLVGRRLESSGFSVFVGGDWLDIFWWREARERGSRLFGGIEEVRG